MNKSRYWSIAVQNIIIGLGWLALAVHFDMWWIALFSVPCFIFMEPVEKRRKEDSNATQPKEQ